VVSEVKNLVVSEKEIVEAEVVEASEVEIEAEDEVTFKGIK
jgi:hypothetical protein